MFSASSSFAFAKETSEYSIQIEYSSSDILNILVFSSTSLKRKETISRAILGRKIF